MQDIMFAGKKALLLTSDDVFALDSKTTTPALEYLKQQLNIEHLKAEGYARVFLLSDLPVRYLPKTVASVLQRKCQIYVGDLETLTVEAKEKER